jgi:hypothetical protein
MHDGAKLTFDYREFSRRPVWTATKVAHSLFSFFSNMAETRNVSSQFARHIFATVDQSEDGAGASNESTFLSP